MRKLIQVNKIYLYFWVTSLIIILIGLKDINDSNAVFDINVHDTYFVIHTFHAATVLSFIYFFLGLGYWIIKKINGKLISALSLIHFIITIGSFLAYWVVFLFLKTFYTEQELLFMPIDLMNNTLVLIFILNLIAQPLYIINIIISLIRKLNNAIA
ncbi:cbb3-type cytochrome c oxidase subunit I [Flavobacterium luminosum]|uniref:Cbb3-type cytochrome c oxidase subunit I n=1 Tax=Flavobacterium luminosum TaxID=2949086 RepID=A0ABT0TTC1_9FLAO|nr:cbb3-type cytochrome c oxidase subunit I [Flavobacterium sp. HXWNR70]MCL9810118.1 cbb3-type cytochrome c oxidase subunit I [Flavobacterium sp. HXWNR70]